MPLNFEDEFDPRSATPFTDAEIRDLYQEALLRGTHLERPQNQSPIDRNLWLYDSLVWTLLLVFPFMLRRLFAPLALAIPIFIVCYAVGVYFRSQQFPFGPFTIKAFRQRRPNKPGKVSDMEMLAIVVDYLVEEPVRYASDIRRRIEHDRNEIAVAITELDQIDAQLRDDLRDAQEETLYKLLVSRKDVMERTLERLRELDAELASQQREANEAVRPVLDMKEQFERLRKITASLGRIRSAHGIGERGDQVMSEHRTELQALRQIAFSAISKLQEINRIVEAHERARDELDF
jgi:uncharacterized membrane protein YccC